MPCLVNFVFFVVNHHALQFSARSRKLRRVNSKDSSQSPKPMVPSAYAAAGVNIDLADALKSGLKEKVRKTLRREVLGAIGGFGGLFAIDLKKHKRPVLVSSMDGVGTKLKVAVAMNKHDTVGQDLVNHCVNDIAVLGAEPLYFLDYIGMGKLVPHVFNQIIDGLARACAEAGCALIGGETAQMPGMYAEGEYDLVGSIVGVVDKDRIIDGSRVRAGDAIIGLASSGLHTNGYSLARQILFVQMRVRLEDYTSQLGCTFGEELLKVHRNYWPVVRRLVIGDRGSGHQTTKTRSPVASHQSPVHGLAHITGGGFYDNIPRALPKNCTAIIRRGTWDVLPIFNLLQENGGLTDKEAYRVFNMGIGMMLIVDPAFVPTVHRTAAKAGFKSYLIGEIRKGKLEVRME
jgi:phosphoribosylformylglycinamidine cyclo-ligase